MVVTKSRVVMCAKMYVEDEPEKVKLLHVSKEDEDDSEEDSMTKKRK